MYSWMQTLESQLSDEAISPEVAKIAAIFPSSTGLVYRIKDMIIVNPVLRKPITFFNITTGSSQEQTQDIPLRPGTRRHGKGTVVER